MSGDAAPCADANDREQAGIIFTTSGTTRAPKFVLHRPAAIGRKNYLFAGSHESAQRTAMLYTFFAACKHHGIDPEQWLTDVLNRINDYKISQLHELMPHHWTPATQPSSHPAGTSDKDTATPG